MAETVRAAVQVAPRKIEVREFPRPKIGDDDALLRVEANGICGSDVEIYKGHMGAGTRGDFKPFVPGHEPLGVIEEIGERAAARWGVQPGDRGSGFWWSTLPLTRSGKSCSVSVASMCRFNWHRTNYGCVLAG